MNVLTLPSERYPRRASDGCASIGQYRMSEREGEDSNSTTGNVSSASQLKAIQQEYQALQVIFIIIFEMHEYAKS